MDILLPEKEKSKDAPAAPNLRPSPDSGASEPWRSTQSPSANKVEQQKLLFTVKPGGIAGYLGLFHKYSSNCYNADGG